MKVREYVTDNDTFRQHSFYFDFPAERKTLKVVLNFTYRFAAISERHDATGEWLPVDRWTLKR